LGEFKAPTNLMVDGVLWSVELNFQVPGIQPGYTRYSISTGDHMGTKKEQSILFSQACEGMIRNRTMTTSDDKSKDEIESQYPGIRASIHKFENANLPACTHYGSENSAVVQIGIMGRTILLAGATSKIKLIINGPKPGTYFCDACKKFFG
jgi:hypothetical protein